MRYLFVDFETRSQLSLAGPSGVGVHAYAEHPSTSVLCLGWALDDGPIKVWVPHAFRHSLFGDFVDSDREWERCMRDPGVTVVASNAEFERAIFRHRLLLDTSIERWDDPSARAARCSLPRKLEDAANALKLPIRKDTDGHRIMMKLSKPRKVSKNNSAQWWEPETKPEDFAKLYSYCRDDVGAMREAHRVLPPLSPTERKVWALTIRSNERGVKIDTAAVPRAQALASKVEKVLINQFTQLTGASPNNPTKAAAALGMPDFTEDTVRKWLAREDISPTTRRALEIRQLQAYSSLKKLDAFRDRTSSDGRLRGMLIYSGAERTQRWSAGGVQAQNFPSQVAIKKADELEYAFEALSHDCLDLVYDDVLGTLSGMLRGFFVGPFVIGDYAQVEARGTAWLAGQDDLVQSFAQGSDPYKQMAAVVYGVSFDKVVKAQREVGKRAILGCGYGMGAEKFQRSLDEQYGIKISGELAERTVAAYRRKYSKIPKLWKDLGDGFVRAVKGQHARLQAGPLEMGMTEIAGHPFAYVKLPSGRALFYGWPQVRRGKREDEVWYFGRNHYAKTWQHVSTWGGKITENAVQGLCRDLLAYAVINMDEEGFPMSWTAHDEFIAEGSDLKRFEAVFSRKPEWASTLALGVECFTTRRYRK